jgi:hypothetical protein
VLRTLCVIAIGVALTGDAFAFQIETPITFVCHEKRATALAAQPRSRSSSLRGPRTSKRRTTSGMSICDFGAAGDHAAVAFIAGGARDYRAWSFGSAAEWNPWFSLDTKRARAGAANVYATIARRWYDGPALAIYSRAEIGTSTVLFSLVGVDQYHTGVYLGGCLLGAAIKESRGMPSRSIHRTSRCRRRSSDLSRSTTASIESRLGSSTASSDVDRVTLTCSSRGRQILRKWSRAR